MRAADWAQVVFGCLGVYFLVAVLMSIPGAVMLFGPHADALLWSVVYLVLSCVVYLAVGLCLIRWRRELALRLFGRGEESGTGAGVELDRHQGLILVLAAMGVFFVVQGLAGILGHVTERVASSYPSDSWIPGMVEDVLVAGAGALLFMKGDAVVRFLESWPKAKGQRREQQQQPSTPQPPA